MERFSDNGWKLVNAYARGRQDLEKPLPQPEPEVVEAETIENNTDEEQQS